jgi:hypothetical protein
MSNLIFIKDNDNNVGIGSNMINDIKGNINITQNLNVSGNLNVLNGEMIRTTGIGSFGSININKLAINGDYGSNPKYLKSNGSSSDLNWSSINYNTDIINKPITITNNNQLTNGAGYITGSGSITTTGQGSFGSITTTGQGSFGSITTSNGTINTGSGSITTTGTGSFGEVHSDTFQCTNTDNKILSSATALKIEGEVGFMKIGKATNNSHILISTGAEDAYIYMTQLHNTGYWDCGAGKSSEAVDWRFRNSTVTGYASNYGYLASSSNGTLTTNFSYTSSDDRLKINEELIENATQTIMKLRPQKYNKYTYLESEINNFEGEQKPQINHLTHEFGFIAQEIYYEIPELRKLVSVPPDAVLIVDNENMNFDDIQNDPDYSNWGTEKASVHYNSFIPLLTKGFQEQQAKINELTSIIDKLKTANSFEEFKNSL